MKKTVTALNRIAAAIEELNNTLCTLPIADSQIHNQAAIQEQTVSKQNDDINVNLTQKQMPVSENIPQQLLENSNKDIVDWLRNHQIGFDHFNHEICNTHKTAQLASYIAVHYEKVQPLMQLLCRFADGKQLIRHRMDNQAPDVISAICFLANELNQIGFLQQHHYKRSPECLLHVRSNGLPATVSYLHGSWFEQAIDRKLCEHQEKSGNISWMRNPVVRTVKGKEREIDLLLNLNREIFILEVTCGQWQQKAMQVLSLAKQLGTSVRQCVIVTPDTPCTKMTEFSALHHCKVLAYKELDDWLESHSELDNETAEELAERITIC
jgi:hypothetical protein